MVLSTQNSTLIHRVGDEKAITMLAEAGFDAIDYSFCTLSKLEEHPMTGPGYREYAKHLKDFAESNGVFFNQAHAVFPSGKVGEEEFNKITFDRILCDMEAAAVMGVSNIVVHPVHCFGHDVDEWQYNMEFYAKLLPYAKQFGIKIALENMWRRDPNRGFIIASVLGFGKELAEFYDALDPRYFTVCLDIGHSALVGEMPDDVIRLLGKRIGCLHVHDVDYLNDNHTLPFTRKLDWGAITNALADIDYIGDFTYEADSFLVNYPDEMLPVALKFMHDTGRQLIKMKEKEKNN